MKIKTLSLFFFAITVLCVLSNAQNINTISYVPVKTGSYDKITTKSVTALAQDIGNVSAKTLKANSSKFTLDTRKLTFGKPVVVKGSVYSSNPATIAVKSKLTVAGVAQANGNILANSSAGAVAVQATNLNMPTRKLDVGTSTIYVDGIAIPNPNCNLEWRSVSAKNAFGQDVSYNLLACKGNGGPSCTCSGGAAPGATEYCGASQYCTKTCQSDCQWSTCVGNSGYTWNGSACVMPSACTDTYGTSVQAGYMSLSQIQSSDTCNASALSYTCQGTAKTCVDYFQNSGCQGGGNLGSYGQAGTWTLVSDDYNTSSPLSSTCTQAATSMIVPSSYSLGDFNDQLAKEVCTKQCYGTTGVPGLACESQCRIVGNCWKQSNNSGYYCQVRDLKCTKTETTCSMGKRDIKCCAK